jgi:hypothetical protein
MANTCTISPDRLSTIDTGGMPERLEPRMLCAFLDVTVGDGAARSLRFLDGDATSVRVSLDQGTASLHLTGDALAQSVEGPDIVVSGTSVALESISATRTSTRSTLAVVTAGGDGRAVVTGITTDGAMKSIKAPGVMLTGVLATGAPASRVDLLGAADATISLGGGSGKSSVYIRDTAIDSDLESFAPVVKLKVGSWTGTGGDDVIAAPSVAKATIEGPFTGVMSLSSAGTLKFQTLNQSVVAVSGSAKRFEGDGATDSRIDVGGSIGALVVQYLVQSHVYAGVGALPPETPIPTRASDFVTPSRIGRVRVNNVGLTFDSTIAASLIGRVYVAVVPDDRDYRDVIVADHVGRVSAVISMASKYLQRKRASNLDNEVLDLGAVQVRAV